MYDTRASVRATGVLGNPAARPASGPRRPQYNPSRQPPVEETHMRTVTVRMLAFAALGLLVLVHPVRAHAQATAPRGLPIAIEPDIIRTNIEGLLATPDVALVTDFY